MVKYFVVIVGYLCLALMYRTALADWSASEAQYSCTAETSTFTLLPYEPSSEDENPPLEPGFKALPDGTTHVKCFLGKRKLRADVSVIPPQSHGMCMGGGAVEVTSLVVDGVELLDRSIDFDWYCGSSDNPIVKIQVRATGSLVALKTCTAMAYPSDASKVTTKCSSKPFDVDAIAAANAKIDHQLADLGTQKTQSAKQLPSENDLAQVFKFSKLPSSNVPLCAHWSDPFLNSIIAPDSQRHGRIAGSKGERIYLHPANPQLCINTDDDGCSLKSYLIPGDRVDVGFICGDWTLVQYERRIRSKPNIIGWIETARLYDVDPLLAPTTNLINVTQEGAPNDPLVQAVATKNIEEMKHLIASGVDPDGIKKSGEPLAAAIETGDASLVQLLLNFTSVRLKTIP
ncbi:MAG: hypothetical protein GC139_10350 [Sideroxydans sp.]|nr:hypothetical protein [Sideroxydans sp.]